MTEPLFSPSLAIRSDGRSFVAYRQGGVHGNLVLAERTFDSDNVGGGESGWDNRTTVDDAGGWGDTGYNPSLALDSGGNPHIAYHNQNTHDGSNNGLLYAYRDSTRTWKPLELVSRGNDLGHWSSLVLDASDRAYISYYDRTRGELKIAMRNRTTDKWKIEIVDRGNAGAGVGACTSIALDPQGFAAISYLDYDNQALKYAERVLK